MLALPPTAFTIRVVNALLPVLLLLASASAYAQTADDRDAQPLDATQPIKRKIAAGEFHYYRISLAADQYVRLVVDQRGVDVSVKLYRPDGKKVVSSNRLIGAYGPETISWVAESSGFYKLEVRSQANQIGAEYEVKILEERTATFQDHNRIPAQNVFMQAEELREQRTPESLNQAIAKYEEALQSWKDIGDSAGQAQTLNVMGLIYHASKRDPVKAQEKFKEALQILESLSDRRGVAETLNNIARVYESGEKQIALDFYKRSLQPWVDAGDRYGEAWTLFNMGRVYSFLRDWTKGLDHYQRALELWEKLGDHSRQAATLHGIGDIHFSTNDYTNALTNYELALAQWEAAVDLNGKANTLFAISRTYGKLENRQKEGEYNQLAEALKLKVRQARTPTPEVQAKSAQVLQAEQAQEAARRLELQGTEESRRKAVEKNEEAVRLFEKAGDYHREVFTLFVISSIYEKLKDKENERKSLDRARLIAERVDRQSLQAEVLQRLGEFYSHSGNDGRAAEYYDRALELWRSQKDRRSEASLLAFAAKSYHKLNDKEKPLAYLERARKLFHDLGDRSREAYILNDIAAIQKTPEAKLDYLKRTRALRRQKGDRAGEAESLKEIIAVYRSMNDKRQTLNYYHQVLALYREIKDGMGEAFILRDLMNYWKELDQPSLAILYGKQAINTYQAIRQNIQGLDRETQTSFIRSKEDIYRDLADLLISDGRLIEAQLVLDMLKEEEFNNFIRGKGRKPVNETAPLTPTEAEVYREYKKTTERATTLSSEHDSLMAKPERTADDERRLNVLANTLENLNAEFVKYIEKLPELLKTPAEKEELEEKISRQVDLRGTLASLGSGSVALYTLVVKNKYRVILFTPRVKIAREYPIKAVDLHSKIMNFLAALHDHKSDPLPLAKELYQILIEPIADDLKGANPKILMWSLDRSLRYLPIAALHDGQNYLVERYSNEVFTPKSRDYLLVPPAPAWRGLGVGVSTFKDPSDPPLPAVPEELNGIFRNEDDPKANGGTFPGKIMLNDESTKDAMLAALRLGRYNLVHVATHFKLIAGDWENSYLVLGQDTTLTGKNLKTMTSIFQNVDLVTLSACNTGLGDEAKRNGEEVDGFGQAAQEQGARAVMATLWAVRDASTGLLMQKFYQSRVLDGKTKAEALKEAQLALLHKQIISSEPTEKDYSHPYFWAPFILIGNWK